MSPVFVIAMLALLLGLQPLTTDLYLPALPLLTEQLGASVAQTQTTFTALLLAFGGSQLLWGPLSDRWGRRPILLTGIGLYVLAAVGCALAPDMHSLIVLRVLQGAALGAAVMAARAIVRDLYQPVEGAQAMSKALTGLGVLACSSPLLGSLLATHLGWRATMVTLALAGSGAWLLVWLHFQESVQHFDPHALRPRLLWQNWRRILSHPTFLAYTATTSCSFAGLVVFLTGSPFVFMGVLGWSAQDIGLLLAANGMVYIGGTILCRRLLVRWCAGACAAPWPWPAAWPCCALCCWRRWPGPACAAAWPMPQCACCTRWPTASSSPADKAARSAAFRRRRARPRRSTVSS